MSRARDRRPRQVRHFYAVAPADPFGLGEEEARLQQLLSNELLEGDDDTAQERSRDHGSNGNARGRGRGGGWRGYGRGGGGVSVRRGARGGHDDTTGGIPGTGPSLRGDRGRRGDRRGGGGVMSGTERRSRTSHQTSPSHGHDFPSTANAASTRGRGWFNKRGDAASATRRDRASGREIGPNQHRTRKPGTVKFMSKDDIDKLARSDPSDVIQCITENEGGFLAAFSHPPNSSNPIVLKRLIKILYLLVNSGDNHLASRIIAEIFEGNSENSAAFLMNLDKAIRRMLLDVHNPHVKCENQHHLNFLVEIGIFAITTVPESVKYTFPNLPLNDTVQKLSQLGEDVGPLLQKVQNLAEDFSSAVEQSRSQQVPKEDTPEYPPPPQSFTDIPVLPTTDEIQPYTDPPYLRPNITTGSYTDWEHYLDVQFRLMREDFVAPLRDGITHYVKEGVASKRISEVRVYNGVSVCSPVCLYTGVGFQIHFDVSRFHRVNWDHSNRLIYGSLLCLSCDNFQTILFATVAKRDPKLLADGRLTIQFEGCALRTVVQIDPNQEFVMVESTAYFEAYRHILERLKRSAVLHLTDRLPVFRKYLVDCQLKPPVPVPRHLLYSHKPELQLKEVLDIKSGCSSVAITDPKSWPSYELTCLDFSQLNAFRAALVQEVSVIQGPPGTGKTFIGLKIVEALMRNRLKLNNFPILVLCYTNHALDQFLEGILSIKLQRHQFDDRKINIVRIGGRCKSKNLESCVLKAKIDELRSCQGLPSELHHRSVQLRDQMGMLQKRIETAQESIKVTLKGNKIFRLPILQQFITNDHLLQLIKERPTERGREIDVWLKLWYVFEEDEDEKEQPQAQTQLSEQDKNELPTTPVEEAKSLVDSDDEFIQVDAEADRLEEDRIIDGVELELPKIQQENQSDLYVSNIPHDNKKGNKTTGWQVVQISDDKRQKWIRSGHSNKPMKRIEVDAVTNIWNLGLNKRWRLYLYWVNELIRHQKQLVARTVRLYNEVCSLYAECRQEIDAHVIKGADIIGMTTTGAAKYNHILSKLYPKVVIIEEAAEVFEAHVFTSLTPSVQQLIMIGDHKQLRPKANCYNLEKKYEFCVSLFERLARNDFPVFTLEVQHRMRPEIASLVCPSIYDKLLNHDDVQHYEHVKGVGKDLFFLDHSVPEKPFQDDRSHSNHHEADFLVALCKYLLKQGYYPSQITILTMYRGQLLELKNKMRRRDNYEGVRVAAVDDFQGEENDIILLSLVRSNSDGNIGFLKVENRICVSLSRAKMGFYVIGNLSMLRDKYETVWPQVLLDLSKRGCTGKALPLYCQNHPQTIVNATCSKDFLKCPEGGCQQKCSVRLDCGHSCPRLCHPTDMEHKLSKCRQKCSKILECAHECKRECWNCKEGCKPCLEVVVKKINLCGHEVEMPCHRDPSSYPCTVMCNKKLECGHFCQEFCSRQCTINCHEYVKKTLVCGHEGNVPCSLDVKYVKCRQPCGALLDCGHSCSGNCEQCRNGRLHMRCQKRCGRIHVCGHSCNFPCASSCPPCMQECNNYCVHSRCPRFCYDRCVPCKERCTWQCEHYKCTRLCGEMCNRPPCNEPCKKILDCGHPCIGLCGEKCPNKCRICDKQEVYEVFFGNEDEEDARFIQFEECMHLIEVDACDTWMEQVDESKPHEVQFKTCPRCKTQIRKSLRYGNIIKQTLSDHDAIKEKQLVSLSHDIKKRFSSVQAEIQGTIPPSTYVEIMKHVGVFMQPSIQFNSMVSLFPPHQILSAFLMDFVQEIQGILQPPVQVQYEAVLPPYIVNDISAQLSYLEHLVKMTNHLRLIHSSIGALTVHPDVSVKDILSDMLMLVFFVRQKFLSDQQKADIQSEIYRLMSLIRLVDLWHKLRRHDKYEILAENEKSKLSCMTAGLQISDRKVTEKDSDKVIEFVIELSEKYKVNGLTDGERIEIVKAIGLTKGHWFKCPNGHFYCIGDCGGATEEAKCPECDATIGGRNHRLRDDNQLAPEMDGAAHAAWSELANLANFDPEQF